SCTSGSVAPRGGGSLTVSSIGGEWSFRIYRETLSRVFRARQRTVRFRWVFNKKVVGVFGSHFIIETLAFSYFCFNSGAGSWSTCTSVC
ncbi:hypothetical protein ABLN67_12540, partial [Mycobacterium tuberculosis]